MLLQQVNGHVERQGEIKTSSFTIQASRKAFEILSSGLYSDKVAAIVRELSTNAADSHTEARQARPFEVHLPNTLEPYFAVKDYGTGMSDDSVFSLYTRYFDSNRSRSNEFTGCLGLGSKSPFSYTDQFQVESRYQGTRRTYTCFIDEQGTPAVTKLDERPTAEPDGVEVRIAVKAVDFESFRDRAQRVLAWFNPRPEVVGNGAFRYPVEDYLRRNSTYGLVRAARGHSNVVMGNVAYPIATDQVIDEYDYNSPEADLAHLLDYGLDLFLTIGAVEISANREQLGYTKTTIDTIIQATRQALLDIEQYSQSLLDVAPTIWQARRSLYAYQKSFMARFLPKVPVWKGQPIDSLVKFEDFKSPPERAEVVSVEYSKLRRNETKEIYANGNPILINDLGLGVYVRTEKWLRDNGHRSAYLLSANHVQAVPADKKPDFATESGVYETVIKVSSLPKPPPRTKSNSSGRTPYTTLLKFVNKGYSRRGAWEPVQKDPADGGVYVECLRFVGQYKGSEYYPHDLGQILASLEVVTGKKVEMFGCRPRDLAKLAKHTGKWVNVFDLAEQVIDKHKTLLDSARLQAQYARLGEWGNVLAKLASELKDHPTLGPLVEKIKEAKKQATKDAASAYQTLARNVSVAIDLKSDELLDQIEKAFAAYPLVLKLGPGYIDKPADVLRYINAIDALEAAGNSGKRRKAA